MRKIITNTTPVLSLLKIDKLDLLKELYGEVTVPNAVYQEIEKGKHKPYYQDLKLVDWIKIEQIKNTDSLAFFVDLDKGEAEVLILAKEQKADLVILDEIMGRRYAKRLELNLTGTMGVLLKAKEKGMIDSIREILTELTEKGTWLNPKLIKKVIDLSNE